MGKKKKPPEKKPPEREVIELTDDQHHMITEAYRQVQTDQANLQRSQIALQRLLRVLGGPNASYDPTKGTLYRDPKE